MSAKLIAPTLQLPSRTPESTFWRPSSKGDKHPLGLAEGATDERREAAEHRPVML